jgi:hypothetical protein
MWKVVTIVLEESSGLKLQTSGFCDMLETACQVVSVIT